MYEIEKGIEIPETRHLGRRRKYPFREMEIGDSFFVPFKTDNPKDRKRATSVILQASRYKRYPDKKFSVRSEDSGVRCWRIS